MYNSTEKQEFSNISATTAAFTLRGGQYGVTVNGTFGGGSVTLQRAALDGTYVTCLTAFTAAGYATVNLPSGSYKVAVATATGVYVDVTSVAVVL
jgi:roadblock/LC7 domain-containing protein